MSDTVQRMPSNRTLGAMLAVALVLALLAQVNMQLTFRRVDHPVPLGAANLESDPEVVRGWYRLLMDQGTYLQFVRTELVDMIWAATIALAPVLLYRFVAGPLRTLHPPIAEGLFRWAPLAAAAGVFDIVENVFSLAMLTDPFGFPEWWSGAHVTASWLKITGAIAAPTIGISLIVVALILRRWGRIAVSAG